MIEHPPAGTCIAGHTCATGGEASSLCVGIGYTILKQLTSIEISALFSRRVKVSDEMNIQEEAWQIE